MKPIFLQPLNNRETVSTLRSLVLLFFLLFIPLFIQAQDEILATLIINGKFEAEIPGQEDYGIAYFKIGRASCRERV